MDTNKNIDMNLQPNNNNNNNATTTTTTTTNMNAKDDMVPINNDEIVNLRSHSTIIK